jgi:hypothetical protein
MSINIDFIILIEIKKIFKLLFIREIIHSIIEKMIMHFVMIQSNICSRKILRNCNTLTNIHLECKIIYWGVPSLQITSWTIFQKIIYKMLTYYKNLENKQNNIKDPKEESM